MKLKYFIPSLVAVVAAIFTGCSKDNDPTYLDAIRVSQSYVALSTNGGSTSIDIQAKGSWTVSGAPEWLSVSPASGTGDGSITFSADAAEGRTCSVSISCEGETQIINVIQGLVSIENATCAEVLAGPDSKTYQVTGVVTSIANTTYGNWYLNDGTGEVYIYGTLDAKGAEKNFSSLGIEVGDQVTVQGPKTTYNGTVELVNVTVVKIVKSLIKVDSLTVDGVVSSELPVAGGEITAHLTCKGTGVAVEIPAEAKEWLGVTSSTVGANPTVTFYAKNNEGGDREVTVTFKTTDGSKEYSSQATITQKGAIIETNVADFLAAEVGTTNYRITGVVTELYTSDKQGESFYIQDYSGKVLVYRAAGFKDSGAKVGDVVTVVGQRGAYKSTPQMVSGTFETVKYAVQTATITELLAKEDDKNTYYMVTGTITSLKDDKGNDNDYGNLFFSDGTSEIYVYGCYPGWGATGDNRKYLIQDNDIKVGDEITIIAYKTSYKGVPQLSAGVCFSFKHAN
jgi:RPA family protein